jgi:hypothetical protein
MVPRFHDTFLTVIVLCLLSSLHPNDVVRDIYMREHSPHNASLTCDNEVKFKEFLRFNSSTSDKGLITRIYREPKKLNFPKKSMIQ